MTYNGGLLGAFSPASKKLQQEIQRHNEDGFRLRHVLPGKHGALASVIQLVCLLCTLAMWAPMPGETLIFERLT